MDIVDRYTILCDQLLPHNKIHGCYNDPCEFRDTTVATLRKMAPLIPHGAKRIHNKHQQTWNARRKYPKSPRWECIKKCNGHLDDNKKVIERYWQLNKT